jgi:hypothetical protein
VELARLRRPKTIRSPSYADFRPKTNAVILLDMGPMLGGNSYRRNRERQLTQNLKVFDVTSVEE